MSILSIGRWLHNNLPPTMPVAIITTDKPGHAHVRNAHQEAHKKYLDANRYRLLAAGDMLKTDGRTAHGGILIVDTDDLSEAEEFLRNDPFTPAGLFDSITIMHWRKAFFNFERLIEL